MIATTMTPAALLDAVRAYALAHYNDGHGWDYVVEAYSDADLLAMFGRARTAHGAIMKVYHVVRVVRVVASVRDDVRGA